jgi:hypothetical protein
VKILAYLLPWLLVPIAGVIYALVAPRGNIDSISTAWDEIKHVLAPMMIAAVIYRIGSAISQGMIEGLKEREQRPGQP